MTKQEVLSDIVYWAQNGFYITPKHLITVVAMVESGEITRTTGKKLLADLSDMGHRIITSLIYDKEGLFEFNSTFDLYFACYLDQLTE